MDTNLLIICLLTFVIHLVGTLAYAVRIAGVRTRRIAISFALFNLLVLVSRTSNSFQGPFLAKRVEQHLLPAVSQNLLSDFRWLLLSATFATIVGAFMIPTFQRIFSRAVLDFQSHRSIPRLLLRGVFNGGLAHVRESVVLPVPANMKALRGRCVISAWMIIVNVVAVGLWTIGVFASLYAGFLKPELRVTSSTLSSIVNGAATVLMFVFIDPHLSVMTDDVVEGRPSEPSFRKAVVWLVRSRFAGTLLAQVLLIPAAILIVFVAERL
jgi:hypothetical protein